MGCSTWDIDVPHGGRTNCQVRLASAVEAEARSNLGPSGLRTTSRQSLERLCFSRRGVFLRKRSRRKRPMCTEYDTMDSLQGLKGMQVRKNKGPSPYHSTC
ncbi:hypothetical protein ACOMHN_013576 [Nucella lapillus]